MTNYLCYGGKIFLQVNYADNRWLSGGRSDGNTGVYTRNGNEL